MHCDCCVVVCGRLLLVTHPLIDPFIYSLVDDCHLHEYKEFKWHSCDPDMLWFWYGSQLWCVESLWWDYWAYKVVVLFSRHSHTDQHKRKVSMRVGQFQEYVDSLDAERFKSRLKPMLLRYTYHPGVVLRGCAHAAL